MWCSLVARLVRDEKAASLNTEFFDYKNGYNDPANADITDVRVFKDRNEKWIQNSNLSESNLCWTDLNKSKIPCKFYIIG